VEQDQQRYERARKRAKDLKDFYTHAIVFVLVNISLYRRRALDLDQGIGQRGPREVDLDNLVPPRPDARWFATGEGGVT
jgi:2TM domain